jgi:GxxExxY protein
MITQKSINQVSSKIIGCAIEVHRQLGPGLLESVYERCLITEMREIGLEVQSQVFVPIIYKGKDLGCKFKLDLLVNDIIIVEEKAVEAMLPLFEAQLLTYLKMTNKPKGLLINFNCRNVSKDLISLVTHTFKEYPIN